MPFKYIEILNSEMFVLPNGKVHYIDNKRYGGNGFLAWERAKGECEICHAQNNLCLHHNNGYSNELKDLIVLCRQCHRKMEVKKYGRKKNVCKNNRYK